MLHEARGHRYAGASFTRDDSRHWAAVPVVLAVAAVAVSTYSAVKQSQAQSEAAKAQARAAEQSAEAQARLDEQIAAAKSEEAAADERAHRRRVALLLGQQRAAFAASGFDIGEGTPLTQELDLVKQGEIESLGIRRAGQVETDIASYRAAATRLIGGSRARLLQFQASQASGAIPLQIAGGVLSAASAGLGAYSLATDWARSNAARNMFL